MRAVVIALLLPGFAVAQDRAPPPPGPDAPAEVLSTAQLAAQDMLQMYEEFCLQRFPGEAAIEEGVAAHHLSVAGAAETSAALLGLMLSLFASASATPWLPNRPEAIVQARTCDQAASRAARDTCMQQAVVRWQAMESRGIRLASNH